MFPVRHALLLLPLALAAPALADTVKLKNGQVLKGRVDDRGAYVIVQKPLGEVRIERAEIVSITMDGSEPRAPQDLDIVVLLSGDEIGGKVRLEDEGKKVVVARTINGQESAVTYDQRQVRTILWSEGSRANPAGGGGIAGAVERLVAGLRATDAAARASALEQLQDLGIFALPYLEKRAPDADPSVQAEIAQVLELARVKGYLTPALVERVPNLARRLVAPEPRERLEALKEAVVASTGDCPPLFVHLARTQQSKEVRAFLVAELALLGRPHELADLLESQDGSLRLAAAVALGDNGIFVGIPVVLESLKMDELTVRKVAIQKLESWTGQFLGFFAEDPPEKRAAAVERWEKWWAAEGKKFVDDALRATLRRDEVSEEDKELGTADWVRAQKAWDAAVLAEPPLAAAARRSELEKARFLLQKSLERYPTYASARLALGILLYTELGDPEGGKRELEALLGRYGAESAPGTKLVAHEHLARIARAAKRWVEADRHYRQALTAGPHDYELLAGLGTLEYERALADEALALPEKRATLEDAVKVLSEAITAVDAHDLEVRESAAAADAVGEATPFRRGVYVKSIELEKAGLQRRAAELRYARGRARAALGQGDDAYQDYAAAAQLAPDNPVYAGAAKAWMPRESKGPKKEGPAFAPDDVPKKP